MDGFHMKERDGVVTLHCDALDALGFTRHCFTTRRGGVSRGYLASMNLAYSREDKETVDENYRRLAAAEGFTLRAVSRTRQVHGARILPAPQDPADTGGVDGLVTDKAGVPLAVFTADCAGILLADPRTKSVGAVHSGWRGTAARICAAAVKQMRLLYGSDPEDIVAAVGPSIGPCCFEVGGDVKDAFAAAGFPAGLFSEVPGGKYHLDLWRAVRQTLTDAGLRAENIHICGECTVCHSDLYYSHRATAGRRGNMAAMIEIGGTK